VKAVTGTVADEKEKEIIENELVKKLQTHEGSKQKLR